MLATIGRVASSVEAAGDSIFRSSSAGNGEFGNMKGALKEPGRQRTTLSLPSYLVVRKREGLTL